METKVDKVLFSVERMLLKKTAQAHNTWYQVRKRDYLSSASEQDTRENADLAGDLALLSEEVNILVSIKNHMLELKKEE